MIFMTVPVLFPIDLFWDSAELKKSSQKKKINLIRANLILQPKPFLCLICFNTILLQIQGGIILSSNHIKEQVPINHVRYLYVQSFLNHLYNDPFYFQSLLVFFRLCVAGANKN